MKGAFRAGWLTSLVLALSLLTSLGPVQAQERTMMPVRVDGEQVRLAVITYKPPGAGPFPTLIFHHGSTGTGKDPSWFADRMSRSRSPIGLCPVAGRSFSLHGVGGAAPRGFTTKASPPIAPKDIPASQRSPFAVQIEPSVISTP